MKSAHEANCFRTFWSCRRGWGIDSQGRRLTTDEWRPAVEVLGGDMTGIRVRACGQQWIL